MEIWEGVEPVETNHLSHDIDGTCVYRLPYDKTYPMASSQDGRHWDKYRTLKRKGFTGTRRLAACKGGFFCNNNECSYLKSCKKANTLYLANAIIALFHRYQLAVSPEKYGNLMRNLSWSISIIMGPIPVNQVFSKTLK